MTRLPRHTEIAQFIAEHPYRPVLPFDYLRVSVIEQSAEPAFEVGGLLFDSPSWPPFG